MFGELAETSDITEAGLTGLINFLMKDRYGTPFEATLRCALIQPTTGEAANVLLK